MQNLIWFVITMEQINNWNILMFISFAHSDIDGLVITEPDRAGVLVLGTRSTRVLNFWYSYCTRTRELQSNSTRTCTCTCGQVLRYSYEYWHEYWYSMVHLMICDVRVKKTPYLSNKQFDLPWRKISKLIYFVIMIEYMIHGMWLQIP